jgi:hypothetical protein
LSNLAYSTDGELYGTGGPNSAGAGPDQGFGEQSYAEIGAAGGGAYANVVDGDDGGYMLTPATGAPPSQGAYDVDFSTPTVGSVRLLGYFVFAGCGTAGCFPVFPMPPQHAPL